MPDEDVVFDDYTLTDEAMARNFAAPAYGNVFLDFYECPDLRLVADFAPVQVYEFRQPDAGAELDVICDAVIRIHR
jgi:hypothetical protein